MILLPYKKQLKSGGYLPIICEIKSNRAGKCFNTYQPSPTHRIDRRMASKYLPFQWLSVETESFYLKAMDKYLTLDYFGFCTISSGLKGA
jgi:hypothetical protein